MGKGNAGENLDIHVLRLSKLRICRPECWTQGAEARDSKGRVVPPHCRSATRFCSTGVVHSYKIHFDSGVRKAALRRLDRAAVLLWPGIFDFRLPDLYHVSVGDVANLYNDTLRTDQHDRILNLYNSAIALQPK